jgi:thiol-disulfide isomerase/thioredoxin
MQIILLLWFDFQNIHMKIILFLFLLSILQINTAVCQEKDFTLDGTINADTGSVKLVMVGDSSLYPKSIRHLISTIQNGKFLFENKLPHPTAYRIESTGGYLSDVIVIEPGKQWVKCNVDSSRILPEIKNEVMQEYASYRESTKEFRKRSDVFAKEYDALIKQYPKGIPESLKTKMDSTNQALYNESDQMLLAYVKDNPGSYWAFWRLIHLMNFGYESIFEQIMPLFADSIKGSSTGKKLAEILERSAVLSVGKKFPMMKLTDVNGNPSSGPSFGNSKYTLIDFWYTSCGPCIANFPSLVEIYDRYHAKGFEIAGIATDAMKYGKDIPLVVKRHKLKWSQFWDINGKRATELSIQAFPTSFLLDASGVIVQKNISSTELAVYLEKNL